MAGGLTALQQVLLATAYFTTDGSFHRQGWPSLAAMGSRPETVGELISMTSGERRALLAECGVPPSALPIFLRAVQHMAVVVAAEHLPFVPGDIPLPQAYLRASSWGPGGHYCSLTPMPVVLAPEPPAPMGGDADAEIGPLDVAEGNAAAQLYSGLRNQGSTCYLNSLLQVLYHLGAFRTAINMIPTEAVAVPGDSIPLALQRLFYAMSVSPDVQMTTELTTSFGWTTRDAFVQHDIHELTRKLTDTIEEAMREHGLPNRMVDLFCGKMENYIEVGDADFQSATTQIFYDLQLVVKGKAHIYESIQAMLEPHYLEGRNQYCLEREGKKSYHDAKAGSRFVSFPPVLMLHLTRFDYDPEADDMRKVMSRYQYYDEIDLSRFTPDLPSEECIYQLHGVLVHSGQNLNFGHYFCFVRCQDMWVKFNDETVTKACKSDVFGANFGGHTLNHWGNEVPHSKSAYMLCYVRKAVSKRLLTLPSDVPDHIRLRFEKEATERRRAEKEALEYHLHTHLHVITCDDLREMDCLFTVRNPSHLKIPATRTLRLQNDEPVEALQGFVAEHMMLDGARCTFWVVGNYNCLGEQVLPTAKASDVARGEREVCVLVIPGPGAPLVQELQLSELGDEGQAADGKEPGKAATTTSALPAVSPDAPCIVTHHFLYDPVELHVSYAESIALPDSAGIDTVNKVHPMLSAHHAIVPWRVFVRCDKRVEDAGVSRPRTGAHYIWQMAGAAPFESLYRDFAAYHEQFKDAAKFELRGVAPPFNLVAKLSLPKTMPYEFVQRHVARVIGEENFDRIWFSRHNGEQNCPFFMKVKKQDKSTLYHLLHSNRTIQGVLYYEVLPKYTVSEIEAGNLLRFDLFGNRCQFIDTHMLIMPPPADFTIAELLQCILGEVGMDPAQAPRFHLLDIWRARIYATYAYSDAHLPKNFEESAEYRVEPVPQPIPDIAPSAQFMAPIFHFHSPTKGQVTTHGDPFLLFLADADTGDDIRRRIAQHLAVPLQQISDWKLRIVSRKDTVDIVGPENIRAQLSRTLRTTRFSFDNQDPAHAPFIGLEHAPVAQRRGGHVRAPISVDLKIG